MNYKTILFFDGVCNLCNGAVDFFVSIDKHQKLRYAPLQGKVASQSLDEKRVKELDTVVLLHNDKVYIKSRAIIQSLIILGFPYSTALIFKIIPPFISDLIYDFIARNRYKMFGKKDTCRLPTSKEKSLFLD